MRHRTVKQCWTTVVAAMLLAWVPGCPVAHRVGWVTTASVMDARDATDAGLAQAFTAKVKQCVNKHGSKTQGYKTCIEATREYKAIAKWRVYGLPAVNSAVVMAKEILEIAEKVNASEDSTMQKVLSALRDAACGIAAIVNEWKDLFPAKARVALAYIDSVKGLACK
jgi:hypothetical protein